MSTDGPRRAHLALRRATAADHHALDHHPLMQCLAGSALTREKYAESLAAMHRPHAQLEHLVHGSPHLLESGLKLRSRLSLLDQDLLELARPARPEVLDASDKNEARSSWWGLVYVLEGSRQGAAVIARRVESSLGDSAPRHFLGATNAPGQQAALLAELEIALEAPADLDLAIAAAREAFAAYQAGLDAFIRRQANSPSEPPK